MGESGERERGNERKGKSSAILGSAMVVEVRRVWGHAGFSRSMKGETPYNCMMRHRPTPFHS